MSDLTALMERVESIDGNVSEIVGIMKKTDGVSSPTVTMDFTKMGETTTCYETTSDIPFSLNIFEDLPQQLVVTDPLRVQAESFGSELGSIVFEGFKTNFNVEKIGMILEKIPIGIPFNFEYDRTNGMNTSVGFLDNEAFMNSEVINEENEFQNNLISGLAGIVSAIVTFNPANFFTGYQITSDALELKNDAKEYDTLYHYDKLEEKFELLTGTILNSISDGIVPSEKQLINDSLKKTKTGLSNLLLQDDWEQVLSADEANVLEMTKKAIFLLENELSKKSDSMDLTNVANILAFTELPGYQNIMKIATTDNQFLPEDKKASDVLPFPEMVDFSIQQIKLQEYLADHISKLPVAEKNDKQNGVDSAFLSSIFEPYLKRDYEVIKILEQNLSSYTEKLSLLVEQINDRMTISATLNNEQTEHSTSSSRRTRRLRSRGSDLEVVDNNPVSFVYSRTNSLNSAVERVQRGTNRAILTDTSSSQSSSSQITASTEIDGQMNVFSEGLESVTGSLNNFMSKLVTSAAGLLETLNPVNILSGWIGALNSGLQGLISAINPISAIFKGINKALAPVLTRLMKPLEHLGFIIGKALIPVVEALIPVFTGLAYFVANIWNAIATVLNMVLGIFGVQIKTINFDKSYEEEQSQTLSDMTNTAGYHQPIQNTFNTTFTGNTVLDTDDEAMGKFAEKFLQYVREHDIEVVT